MWINKNQVSSSQVQVQVNTVVTFKEPKEQENKPNKEEGQGFQVLTSLSIVQVVEFVK